MFGNSAFAETPFAKVLLAGLLGNVNVNITGQAGTSAVGAFTFIGKANVTPGSQVVGTSAVGGITFDAGGQFNIVWSIKHNFFRQHFSQMQL